MGEVDAGDNFKIVNFVEVVTAAQGQSLGTL